MIKNLYETHLQVSDLEKSIEFYKRIEWLRGLGFEPRAAFGKEPIEPIVHTWMPAASIYFYDPDGKSLELIAWLDGEPLDSGDVPYLSEWRARTGGE